jgi:hypothetical protein
MDYDADGNVRNLLAHYQGMSGTFVDIQAYDCVTSDDCLPIE